MRTARAHGKDEFGILWVTTGEEHLYIAAI